MEESKIAISDTMLTTKNAITDRLYNETLMDHGFFINIIVTK